VALRGLGGEAWVVGRHGSLWLCARITHTARDCGGLEERWADGLICCT
jgi:hypothetical protein